MASARAGRHEPTGLCACENGYDGSLMAGILAKKPYLDKFQIGTRGSGVSLVFSMYSVGSLIGSFPAAFVADRFGRKPSMWLGAVFIIVGMVIASAAQDFSVSHRPNKWWRPVPGSSYTVNREQVCSCV